VPGAGDDSLDGGPGKYDTAVYKRAVGPVAISLKAGTATGAWGTDSLTGLEDIVGSRFDDTLTGDAGPNFMGARSGMDTLIGLGGDDIVQAGKGNDSLDGGPDTDRLDGGGGTDACTNGESNRNCE
jgi:Ca2+-binding RTX toxin-like protein